MTRQNAALSSAAQHAMTCDYGLWGSVFNKVPSPTYMRNSVKFTVKIKILPLMNNNVVILDVV